MLSVEAGVQKLKYVVCYCLVQTLFVQFLADVSGLVKHKLENFL